jgi:hypothetical protein
MPKQVIDQNTNLNVNDFDLKDVIKFKWYKFQDQYTIE